MEARIRKIKIYLTAFPEGEKKNEAEEVYEETITY